MSFAYGGNGRLAKITDTQARDTAFIFNAAGYIETMTDSTGRVWRYEYTGTSLTKFTDPELGVTRYEYDAAANLNKVIDPRGNETRMVYDGSKRLTELKRVTDPVTGTGPKTTFAYSTDLTGCGTAAVKKTVVTDDNNRQTKYCVDQENQVERTIDAKGRPSSSTFDSRSNVTQLASGGGTTESINSYTYSQDGNDNVLSGKSASNATFSFTYGVFAHPNSPATYTNEQGRESRYGYDAAGNMKTIDVVKAGGGIENQVTLAYNDGTNGTIKGTVKTSTDGRGNTTTYAYDPKGNLTTITPPAPAGGTTFTYDGLSRVKTKRDGKGQTTTYDYDKLDRLTKVTYHDGSNVAYVYDSNGNRTMRTDATGTTTWTIDKLGRPAREARPNSQTVDYTYDGVGNLLTLSDPGGTVAYRYDEVNLVDRLTEPGRNPVTFTYDTNYNPDVTSYPNGVTLDRDHDSAGQLTRITGKKGLTVLSDFTYSFVDSAGQARALRQSVTDKNGDKTSYTYDHLDRLGQAETRNPSGTVIDSHRYTYDANSNRLSQVVNGVTTSYEYNAANQMTKRIEPTYTRTYTHDANGNLTGDSAGRAWGYNSADQTTSIKTGGSDPAVTFAYGGEGQDERMDRTTAQDGTVTFGQSLLGMVSRTTSSGPSHYTRGPRGELIGQRKPGGADFYYLMDGLGSVVAMTDSAGNAAATYKYDPFGNITAETGNVYNPWKFAGEYYSDSVNHYSIGARWYEPDNTDRWTQPDPLDQVTDPHQANRYVYAGANPVNWTDPTGCSIKQFVNCVSARVATKCSFTVAKCSILLRAPIGGWQAYLGCVGVFCGPRAISAMWKCKGRL